MRLMLAVPIFEFRQLIHQPPPQIMRIRWSFLLQFFQCLQYLFLFLRDHMPQKCRLTIHSNRVHIQNTFAAARDALKRLESTLYHYARAGHPMRTASKELSRRFQLLDKDLSEKLKSGARHI